MKYSYLIKNEKIYELEDEKITFDVLGHRIQFLIENKKFLIENKNPENVLTRSFQRKIKWLETNHPELLM